MSNRKLWLWKGTSLGRCGAAVPAAYAGKMSALNCLQRLRLRHHSLLAVLAASFGLCACSIGNPVRTGQLQTDVKAVKLGDAKSVRVEISMGAGELKIEGGATNLLDAQFTYDVPAWKPLVEYNASGGEGRLSIRQPGGPGGARGSVRYDWNLRLNGKVPLSIDLQMGAGRTNLTLGQLSLTNLDVKLGAGEAIVDLTGDWKNDLSAHVRGGVGRATLRLPRDMGVRVAVAGGIGAINARDFNKENGLYVNDAYGKSPVTLRIDVEGGIGEIDLELPEAPPVV